MRHLSGYEVNSESKVYCGVAGWCYRDWKLYVYPPVVKNLLSYIAGWVDCIEINSTFYTIPSMLTVKKWLNSVEQYPDFIFTAKLPKEVTHDGIIDKHTVNSFLKSLSVLTQKEKLKHLLAQFKYNFTFNKDNCRYIAKVLENYKVLSNITIELRHYSWQTTEAIKYLYNSGINVCHLDYPVGATGFSMDICPFMDHAYFRLHGRNSKEWFNKNSNRDKVYDYLYSEEEIKSIKERIKKITQKAKTLVVIMNNHYQGKELVNALQLKAELNQSKIKVPLLLAEHYPVLKKIALNSA